jgi:sialate O-acetylesterase
MEMPIKGFENQPIEGAEYYISSAKTENGIRMYNVSRNAAIKSTKIGKGKWLECNHQDLPDCSAAAYFFALRLQALLNVPIGIINSSYGGSSIEGWLNPIAVQKHYDFNFNENYNDENAWKRPYVMYQNMLKPFGNYVINGFIWYQGESNVGRFASYEQKLSDLVSLWRATFNNPELPFYVVEITPFLYENSVQAAKFREAQFKGINVLKNTGFVCTNDLVNESEATNIHPSQKKQIGDRLANLVLHDIYFHDTINAYSPTIDQVTITSDAIVLSFKNCYEGIQNQNEFIGFEVADSTRNFRTAKPILGPSRNTLIIKIDPGFEPISVRYSFKNFQVGNVKNSEGLPLVPFRTDDWGN